VRTHCRLGIGHLRPRDASRAARARHASTFSLSTHAPSPRLRPSRPLHFPPSLSRDRNFSSSSQAVFFVAQQKLTTEELLDRTYRIGRRQDPESPSPHAARALRCPRRPFRSPQIGKGCRMYIGPSGFHRVRFSLFRLRLARSPSPITPFRHRIYHQLSPYHCARRRAPHDDSVKLLDIGHRFLLPYDATQPVAGIEVRFYFQLFLLTSRVEYSLYQPYSVYKIPRLASLRGRKATAALLPLLCVCSRLCDDSRARCAVTAFLISHFVLCPPSPSLAAAVAIALSRQRPSIHYLVSSTPRVPC